MSTELKQVWSQNGPTEIAHDGAPICLIEVGNRVSVELTGSITNGVGADEVQDVANLILAARDLLAAARMLAALDQKPGRTFPSQDMCDFARNATARATGAQS